MKRMLLVLIVSLTPSALFARQAVFVVRHAERADAGMAAGTVADPDLSDAGRARAEALAAMLKDARIAAIYVTEFKRTRQTADPLARRLGIEPIVVSSKDTNGLVAQLKSANGNVLVVGHSNTVPAIAKALGTDEHIAIGDAEFDNLLIVTPGATPSVLRLRYR